MEDEFQHIERRIEWNNNSDKSFWNCSIYSNDETVHMSNDCIHRLLLHIKKKNVCLENMKSSQKSSKIPHSYERAHTHTITIMRLLCFYTDIYDEMALDGSWCISLYQMISNFSLSDHLYHIKSKKVLFKIDFRLNRLDRI